MAAESAGRLRVGWKDPAAVGWWVSVCPWCGHETSQGRSSAPKPEDERRSQG